MLLGGNLHLQLFYYDCDAFLRKYMYIRSEYESKKKLKYLQSYKPPQENNVTSKFVFDLGDLKMASATSVNYLYHDGLHATSPSLKLSPWFTMYIAFRANKKAE